MLLIRTLPLLLSGCALFKLAATTRSHPPLDGSVDAPGAQAGLVVHRDTMGVPHIDAANEADAWYGLGFVHAQDRLFQADVSRHVAHGRISDFLGERAVDLDAFVATMGLLERAAAALEQADPETRSMITAYTAGLNAGVASLKTLPIEYRLLGVGFEPWTEADTMANLYLMAWSLQENLDHELAAIELGHLPSDVLDDLFRTYEDTPPIDPFWEDVRQRDLGQLTDAFKAFTGSLGGRPEANSQASNNWVVSGSRTASGKPILANDPHLVQRVPSLWYAADIQGGDVHVAGATFPGTPGFPSGHTEHIAWGVTNVMADTVDLAVLERDGEAVIISGRPQKPEARTVTLHPRKGEPVTRTVQWTSLGPIVNQGGEVALVLRWAALDTPDRTLDILNRMTRATTIAPVLEDLRELPTIVPQNVVLADTTGSFAFQVMGSIPRRHGYTGRVPYPASDNALHWDGFLEDLANEVDPEHGYLATANNKPDHPSADAVATAYIPPHRYRRIMERLGELDQATPADMAALHTDVLDMAARNHLPGLIEGVSTDGPGAPCLELLREWDFQSTVDARAPTVWGAFQKALFEITLSERLDATQVSMILDLMSPGRNPLHGGFETFLTDRETQVAAALDQACASLTERYGDPENWAWGEVHQLRLKHPFGSRSKLLDGWNMEPHPFPGSGTTVGCASYEWKGDEWDVGFMASMRLVMPLDDLGSSTFVHPGGQGGQPKSPFYRSHYEAFVAGETLPLWFDDDDVRAHAAYTLTLTP